MQDGNWKHIVRSLLYQTCLPIFLRASAEEKAGIKADVGVMNMGGIRNLLNEGEITIESVYEITPFENKLAIVALKGSDLLELFSQMAGVHGEGISGAKLIISEEGELLDAKVGGKNIEPEKEYQIATIDYLAEGNDRLEAFKRATGRAYCRTIEGGIGHEKNLFHLMAMPGFGNYSRPINERIAFVPYQRYA